MTLLETPKSSTINNKEVRSSRPADDVDPASFNDMEINTLIDLYLHGGGRLSQHRDTLEQTITTRLPTLLDETVYAFAFNQIIWALHYFSNIEQQEECLAKVRSRISELGQTMIQKAKTSEECERIDVHGFFMHLPPEGKFTAEQPYIPLEEALIYGMGPLYQELYHLQRNRWTQLRQEELLAKAKTTTDPRACWDLIRKTDFGSAAWKILIDRLASANLADAI